VNHSTNVYDVLVLRDGEGRLSRTKAAQLAQTVSSDVLVHKFQDEMPAKLQEHARKQGLDRLKTLYIKQGDLLLVHERPPITSVHAFLWHDTV
jgi:hypothetical protein